MQLSAIFLLPLLSHAADVALVSFDGANQHKFASHDDPVMGGQSRSTTQVSDGVLTFKGKCAIVPFLKAPGFVTTRTKGGKWADVSACSAIKITAKSNVDYKGYRISFGYAHAPDGGRFAYGFKANLVVPVGKFGDVVIPFKDFTDDWNDGTGNPVKTCAEDRRLCPDNKTLGSMGTLSIWGEGVEGDVDLEVKSIAGTDCEAFAERKAECSIKPGLLCMFDRQCNTVKECEDWACNVPASEGRHFCGPPKPVVRDIRAAGVAVYDFSAPQGVSFYEVNDPVMGGASSGTFSANSAGGYGRLNGTVALIPFLKAPGFIKAISCRGDVPVGRFHGGVCHKLPTFPDISAQSHLILRVRSSTPSYAGFKLSFNSYKTDFKATSEWSDVVLPFTSFSNKWSGATGEPTTKCSDDKSVCPTKEALANIQDIEIWAEGHAGDVTLDIQKISAGAAATVLV